MAASSASQDWLRRLVILTGLTCAVAALYWAQEVLIPVALAILFSFVLTPVVSFLQRRRLSRVPAVFIVVLVSGLLVAGLGRFVMHQVISLADALPKYETNIENKIAEIRAATRGGFIERLQHSLQRLSKAIAQQEERDRDKQQAPSPVQGADEKPQLVKISPGEDSSKLAQISSALGPVLAQLARAGLVVVLVVFLLIKREEFRNRLLSLFGRGRLTVTTKAFDDAGRRISRYLSTQLIVNGGLGLALGIGFLLIGVPYALLWGFLIAVLRYVPYIGAGIAILFPVTLSFLTSENWTQPIAVLALFLVLEIITAMVIEPWFFGHNTGVSAAALLVAVAFWTWLWGPIGLVLATPLTVCLVVLGKYVPHLKFFDTLLGDEPALDASVGYYQRLLARDQDEAADLAIEQSKNRPLEQVFDDLLIPALIHIRGDVESDALTNEDQEFVLSKTRAIVDELAALRRNGRAAEDATAADETISIVGCPARDETDETALAMLEELLDPRRCEFALAGAALLSSEVVALVEKRKATVVCIASLPPGGAALSRLLCRRLRARFPTLTIIVGCWGLQGDPAKNREQLLAAGADQFATTLAETRDYIMSLAPLDNHRQCTSALASSHERDARHAVAQHS
jgi:predicted PurR-regulated permease PerM